MPLSIARVVKNILDRALGASGRLAVIEMSMLAWNLASDKFPSTA